jgi:hypothetical protein
MQLRLDLPAGVALSPFVLPLLEAPFSQPGAHLVGRQLRPRLSLRETWNVPSIKASGAPS